MKSYDYVNEKVEIFDLDGLSDNEKKLLNYAGVCFSYMLEEMNDGISNINLCFPDVLIERRVINGDVYSFTDERYRNKTIIIKKYYFPVKTKKEFFNKLKSFCNGKYVIKGLYSYNDVESVSISSYREPIDNINNAHFIDLTVYTMEKFRECFINELNELERVYDETLSSYLNGTFNIGVDIDKLYNDELSRLFDFYDEVLDKEEILKSLNIKTKTCVRKY